MSLGYSDLYTSISSITKMASQLKAKFRRNTGWLMENSSCQYTGVIMTNTSNNRLSNHNIQEFHARVCLFLSRQVERKLTFHHTRQINIILSSLISAKWSTFSSSSRPKDKALILMHTLKRISSLKGLAVLMNSRFVNY